MYHITYTLKKFNSHIVIVDKDGFVNATKLCTQLGKDYRQWQRLALAKSIIKNLADHLEVSTTSLIKLVNRGLKKFNGTYVHPALLIHIVSWCSSIMSINLCNEIIDTYQKNPANVVVRRKVDKYSGIYLVKIGKVKHVQKYIKIPINYESTDTVYKFGMSFNVPRRFITHEQNFSFEDKIEPSLVYSKYIDCRYRYNAEAKLKEMFDLLNIRLRSKKYNELIIFSNDKLPLVKTLYDGIHSQFKHEPI